MNSTRLRKHLKKDCPKYLEEMKKRNVKNVITVAAEHERRYQKAKDTQRKLAIPTLSAQEKHELDIAAASVCYIDAREFTLWETKTAKHFLKKLHPAYKPPSRQQIAGKLLDECYQKVKSIVDEKILSKGGRYSINTITDESTNITGARISNISLHTDIGQLHWRSEDIGAKQMNADNVVNWLKDHLIILSEGDYKKINSIANDTCPLMLSVADIIHEIPELKHVFSIPCDSHGIQLLIKNLTAVPCFKGIFTKAQAIAKGFKNSPLQLSRLRECQLTCYKKKKSICLAVITRWGTQYRLIRSLLNTKDALRQYVLRYESHDIGEDIHESIISRQFWTELEALCDLLKPIDEALKMSESGKGHLGYVLERWKNIYAHLLSMQKEFPGLDEFLRINGGPGTFANRYNRQVKPIHIAAFYLMPSIVANRDPDKEMDKGHKTQILAFIEEYAPSPEMADIMQDEFLYYINQEGKFESTDGCWKRMDKPLSFWLMKRDETELAKLALRIFKTPANSVASEQAFSVQNAIHTKTRNRLTPDKVDKLVYIYRNSRTLGDALKIREIEEAQSAGIDGLNEQEMVELEDAILEAMRGDDGEEVEDFDMGTEDDNDEMEVDSDDAAEVLKLV